MELVLRGGRPDVELVLRGGRPALNEKSKWLVRRSGKTSMRKCAEERAGGKQADTQAKSMLNKRQCEGLRQELGERVEEEDRERETEVGSGGNRPGSWVWPRPDVALEVMVKGLSFSLDVIDSLGRF